MQPSDQEIIAGFLAGESEAVRLVDDWIKRAASPFRRRLDSHWEDALQAARMQITRLLRQSSFRGEATLKTYLWRVVNHTCIDQIRVQSRTGWVDLDSLSEQESPSEDSPLNEFLQKESQQILLRVLEEVPSDCRELWSMILSGQSYRQMSLQLGMSEGALRVKVLRCRKKAVAVRDQLKGKQQDGQLVTFFEEQRL